MPGRSPLSTYPELRTLIEVAQLHGATYVEHIGPAIGFFRIEHNKVKYCFAEYSSAAKRYEWIWEPPDWREYDHLPKGAMTISEFLSKNQGCLDAVVRLLRGE
jgi:hypothetical protein